MFSAERTFTTHDFRVCHTKQLSGYFLQQHVSFFVNDYNFTEREKLLNKDLQFSFKK